jgi:hypothetical protein
LGSSIRGSVGWSVGCSDERNTFGDLQEKLDELMIWTIAMHRIAMIVIYRVDRKLNAY